MPAMADNAVGTVESPSRSETPGPEQQLLDMQVILHVARALAGTTCLAELLTLILESVRSVLHADRATLFHYDAANNEFYGRIDNGTVEIRFPADRGLAGAAAQSRQIVNVPDVYADPRFNRAIDQQTGYRTRCILTVPLLGLENKLVGVLQALNKRSGVFTAYDERLAEALAAQIAVAIQRAQLMEHYVQKKQWERGMELAREIQESLWPKAPPQVAGYDIAGWSRPADATGGDCYDFVPMDGQFLTVILADASGHGIGPCLVIAETRALLRSLGAYVPGARELLARVNAILYGDLTDGRFVTALYGVLDATRHTFEYASAGQAPLYWYRAATKTVESTGCTGLPLAVIHPTGFDAAPTIHFAPGDIGLFLTDGFCEAHLPRGPMFGEERLMSVITQNAHRSAREIIAAMAEAVSQFLEGASPPDDLTAIVVKRVSGEW